ncbi:uncharacterized protein LOC107775263 [Nicotiana tabacum]|uniref:Uncharacterized protein LOC107775263 n=2 Tax=Nicotiana TaxID=4085 RepID=A0A1S3YEP4_TOBAC|nr:PREDICTED: uncharacterized protein LOC104247738 [Nicotiana sylvestris]XP_016450468.1 PREDICTED: uncharacterized protein LOC107775263 [Nicotiana tabacum]
MGTNGNSSPNNTATHNAIVKPVLLPEIGPDGIARESPVIAYTEKIIEEEQLQLRKYIDENYSKIRDVERELTNLNMEMKLTAGPKKAALELMRKKIEMSTERIRVAKLREEQARKAWEAASQAVKDEEANKQKLCEDLNSLVLESSNSQLARLEELKRRLEAMNPSRASTASTPDQNPVGPVQSSMTQDVSSVKDTQEPSSGSSGNTSKEGNDRSSGAENGQNQLPSLGEARGKKKINLQGRVKGIGIVPKGRGSTAPGWTGAGFDVDGRS